MKKPNMENINSAMALKQKELRRKCAHIADELREISLRLSEEGEILAALEAQLRDFDKNTPATFDEPYIFLRRLNSMPTSHPF